MYKAKTTAHNRIKRFPFSPVYATLEQGDTAEVRGYWGEL
jgi:hypothetical protein